MRFRLYVDEVGVSDLGAATRTPNERFLSLTGVIASLDGHARKIQPAIDMLKGELFGHTPRTPVILHRREIIRREGPFSILENEEIRNAFDEKIIHLITTLPYRVITVAIDKLDHFNRYGVWHFDPYHYCLRCLVERFVLYLNQYGFTGDVVVETRYKDVDKKLKASYQRIYETGTEHVPAALIQTRLTTKEIKFSAKAENIAGVQLADALAHPCFRAMRLRRQGDVEPDDFGTKIVKILDEKKYRRSRRGIIDGYGRKWLP